MTAWVIAAMVTIILGDIYIQWHNRQLDKKEGKWVSSLLKERDPNFNKPNPYYSKLLLEYNKTQKARFMVHVKREIAIRSHYYLANWYKDGNWLKHHKLRYK